jgi:hypothetical protein
VSLPLSLSICQTNGSGACLTPPAASVTLAVNASDTPTFSIFATATGTIADLPGANRVAVQFTDSSGVIRGSTSIAVDTLTSMAQN